MFKDVLKNYINNQVFIATDSDTLSGILLFVTDQSVIIRTMFPGYGDMTDYNIRLDKIAFVRVNP